MNFSHGLKGTEVALGKSDCLDIWRAWPDLLGDVVTGQALDRVCKRESTSSDVETLHRPNASKAPCLGLGTACKQGNSCLQWHMVINHLHQTAWAGRKGSLQ